MDAIPVFVGNSKNVLLLGSGLVARPTLEILDKAGYTVTVACRKVESAKKLTDGLTKAHALSLDINDESALDHEVAKNILVISLIPYIHHVSVIKSAIRNKKNVVTTSYISPAMMELDEEAKEAGITVLNEVGLDPGIDHLYAVKTIDEVHKAGGRILSFLSYCGGLPAPEHSDNPLGYKFSWSPRGSLLALRNSAKFYKDGKVVEVPSTDIMKSAKPYHIYPGYSFVAYPNRDSTAYRLLYGIPEANTIIRGTLRYTGFPEFVQCLVDLGFLSEEESEYLQPSDHPPTWKEATAKILGATSPSEQDIIWAISSKATFSSTEEKDRVVAGLRWVGLFSDEPIVPLKMPLDTLCATLEKLCPYAPGERDMVMLQHKFEIENENGFKQTLTSTLVEYGDPIGHSAMAKLVGVPCAVAAQQVMNGTIKKTGVLAPLTPEICEPLRKQLREEYGIELKEKIII